MSDIVVFDPSDLVVANRVLKYLKSVNTPDYNGNILINPDTSFVSNISIDYWKVNGESIEEMTDAEKFAIDIYINSKNIPAKNFLVKEYNNRIILKETWYEKDNGNSIK